MVRRGALAEPSALSEPVVATWYTVIALAPFPCVGGRSVCRPRLAWCKYPARAATRRHSAPRRRQHTAALGDGRHVEVDFAQLGLLSDPETGGRTVISGGRSPFRPL